ncbi:VirB3 family type IV secretion system protein [Pseudomonas amygdali pv. morsprunorum]|uniref:VirB4 family type IV secretion/conjugal transfer ATPase n=1 Tax=Pseudomonas amygdali TaxID=47877 RepID=UPI00288FA854|nr:VirB3 family type IV secretion system protein [Pseudomonas amygdali]MDT3268703.1 VirB3 family type IV secretion system protein [Pseudomonas amygdali pv. morsprunorum]
MSNFYKALRRPALYFGVPVGLFFVVVAFLFLMGLYTTKAFWLLIPIAVYAMSRPTKKDEYHYNLLYLKIRTRLNKVAERYFKTPSILASHYDAVDIQALDSQMKLNDRTAFEDIIPYSSHVSDHIVRTKDGDLVSTWQLLGDTFEFESADSLALSSDVIDTLIKSFSGYPVTFYVHNVRESFYDGFSSDSGNAFSDTVSRLYYEGIERDTFKTNTLYFSATYKPYDKLERAENKRLGVEQKKRALNNAIAEMEEIRGRLSASLGRYAIQPLGLSEHEGATFSSQASFYHFLVTGVRQKVRVSTSPLYQLIGGGDVFFGPETGQISVIDKRRFFRSLEIKDVSTREIADGMLDVLLYADVEYVMTQSLTLMSKTEALKSISSVQKKLRSVDDEAVSQAEALRLAKDELTSGDISFGNYHFTLFVYADSVERLVKDTNALVASFTDIGLIMTLSTQSLAPAFCAQLPGVFHLRPRLAPISSKNFSELASFHNFYTGKRDKAPWGEAIAILKTPSKQAYYLNAHNVDFYRDDFDEKNLANTAVYGTAGVGKTMTLSFMLNMMQKYGKASSFSKSAKSKKLTTVYFDKDRGAEINIRAMGGEYYAVKSGEPTGWNPFYLPKNKRNLAMVKSLMKLLVTRNGETITSRDETVISQSVDAVFDMEPIENRQYGVTRMLEHISEAATEQVRSGGLVVRLSHWAQGGQFGWVFDNAEDTFNPDTHTTFGIDGTEFLDDKDTCTPISFYLLYRVTQLLDGRRMVIFLDEFWKWLGDVAFKGFVYDKLKTIRKLNGMVIPATQSPDEVLKSDIARAVIEVCGTAFYLANPNAIYAEYVDGLGVTPEAYRIIKKLDPTSRQMVVRKSSLKKGDSKDFYALVTLDLSGLGVYTKVLSSSAPNLEIFDSLFKDGMTPDEWLDAYLKLAI